MPDDVKTSTTPTTPVAETPAVVAPVAETPVVASVPVVETPAVVAAPVTETPAVVEPTPVESILGDPKTEVKDAPKAEPTEVKKTETDPKADIKAEGPADGKAPETKVELPKYEDFKLPDYVKIDAAPLSDFSKILGEIETGKLDHKGYQEVGQKMIDMAAEVTKQSIENLNKFYTEFHDNQKKTWFENAKNDPELGNGDAAKFTEISESLRDAIVNYGGNADQQKEFRQVMKDTGVGNHPAVLRMLNNMASKINKYETESTGNNGGTNRIVGANKPAPSKVKDYQRFYGTN